MKSNVQIKKKKAKAKYPEAQVDDKEKRDALNQKEKDETLMRFLFPKNPRTLKNLIQFSFANEEYVSIEQIDHTVFHLNLKPKIILKDSDEGKKQMALIEKKLKINSCIKLKDNECIYYNNKNCFDYIDRHVQTIPISYKDEYTKPEPQEINEICDTACQSIIYDAYYTDFQKISNEEDKNEKEKNDKHDKNETSSNYSSDSSINKYTYLLLNTENSDTDILSNNEYTDYSEKKSEIDNENENETENESDDFYEKEKKKDLKDVENNIENDLDEYEYENRDVENNIDIDRNIYDLEKSKDNKIKKNKNDDLYFLNYKDPKQTEHSLKFIYCDNRIKKKDKMILKTKSFLKCLKLMDKIYNKNNEEKIYLSYKNKNNKNILTKLWLFFLNYKHLIVTDIKFHPIYQDMFAVAYKTNNSKKEFGILSCFTFKNTKNPDIILKTNFYITCIEWSYVNYSLIILGLSNGNICIYDLKKNNKKESLIYQTNLNQLYNTDIISQIKFHQYTKSFYSVSYDGHIYVWNYNQKFTIGNKLLTLKKHINDFNDRLNIIHTQPITCFDFNPFEPNFFLIGTTKGNIYLYSNTYLNNYIHAYNEHNMEINNISYNPYKKNIFLSSSYDWFIRIWDQQKTKSLIIIDIKQCVYDACWSPFLSTCFFVISGNNNGTIHIYDLSIDINKAIYSDIIKKKKLRKICMNKFNDVLLIGDEHGYVHSYKISYNFNQMYMNCNDKIDNFQIKLMDYFLKKVQ